ncbi:retrovirus-related Pol polyprotein from transposon 297 [Trichonephila clavipes]|nr:retrovirus-related Pol polyprotein from transposon 297 [Trichonephila clavipes]
MPFGLSTCPSTFQRFINTVFRDLVVQGIVLPYVDDIVILAKNESEAIDRLKKVLQVSSHIIENNKLFPSPSKTKSVVNYPEPKTTKEVQRFLGLTGYFRKFIPAYSVIAKPLSDLLRKDTPFNFDVKQKASFDELKRLLCQKPVLVIYSQFGLAIHQNDHQARRRFVEWAQNEIAVVPDFHNRNLFSDEAHFWLNGYVNKRNCRIWSKANPQVYVETPLHPEKLTVWCALWAGGIIGPYFKNDEGHNVTVNGDRGIEP